MDKYSAAYPGYTIGVVTKTGFGGFTIGQVSYNFPSPEGGLREPIPVGSLVAVSAPSNHLVKEVAILKRSVPGKAQSILEKGTEQEPVTQ